MLQPVKFATVSTKDVKRNRMGITPEQLTDLKVAAANAAPGAAASVVAHAEGISGADLVTYATFTLITVQVLYYVWKWRRDIRRHERERRNWEQSAHDRRAAERRAGVERRSGADRRAPDSVSEADE